MEKVASCSAAVPRPSKCIGSALVIVFCLVTIVFFMPLDDGMFSFYLPSLFTWNNTRTADETGALFSSLLSNITIQLEETMFHPRVGVTPLFVKHLPSDIIALSRSASSYSLPLIILDQMLLLCIKDIKHCVKMKKRESFLFGIFRENTLAADHTVSSLSGNWNVSVFNQHYVVKRKTIEIILAFIERRSNYWYVNGLSDLSLSPFALLPPKNLSVVAVSRESVLIVPNPLDDTIRQLNRSQFLECNKAISKSLREKYRSRYSKSSIIDESLISHMAYFRDLLLELNIVPFLFGGTLLGWYRECGLIPDTTDLDLGALASDFTWALETKLKSDKRLKLFWILGKPDDSLEYSVYTHSVKIDLFFLYHSNVSTSWVGGMRVSERIKLRWFYPRLDRLCTADLKGYLFNVPCNVEGFLKADYGPQWYEPHPDSNFVWYKSHKNIQEAGKWSFKDWPSVYRTFS